MVTLSVSYSVPQMIIVTYTDQPQNKNKIIQSFLLKYNYITIIDLTFHSNWSKKGCCRSCETEHMRFAGFDWDVYPKLGMAM